MLLEGIDWRRPERTWTPQIAVQVTVVILLYSCGTCGYFYMVSRRTALMIVALPDLDQLDIEALKMLVIEEREQRLEAHAAHLQSLAAQHLELIRACNRSNI
jgi:hypothetical protein